jgi:hypothetical protein
MATTWSFNWKEFASSFLITVGILFNPAFSYQLSASRLSLQPIAES